MEIMAQERLLKSPFYQNLRLQKRPSERNGDFYVLKRYNKVKL